MYAKLTTLKVTCICLKIKNNVDKVCVRVCVRACMRACVHACVVSVLDVFGSVTSCFLPPIVPDTNDHCKDCLHSVILVVQILILVFLCHKKGNMLLKGQTVLGNVDQAHICHPGNEKVTPAAKTCFTEVMLVTDIVVL